MQNLSLHSLITPDAQLKLRFVSSDLPEPTGKQIIIAMKAAPVNPTDLNLLLAGADLTTINPDNDGLSISLSANLLAANARRVGRPQLTGLEGAGIVVATGSESRHYLGQTAAVFGTGAFATHRLCSPDDCIFFGKDLPPAQAAASFVNPLTALCMIDNARRDGHPAIIHTAAASSLGRMLERLCQQENIPLINILRSDERAAQLLASGAIYALNSEAPDFHQKLSTAIRATDASLAFDAIGGGSLAGQLMAAMEEVFGPPPEAYNIYGSRRLKQVYIYGGLTPGPISVQRGFGMAWSVSGWLMMNYLSTLPQEKVNAMKQRIRDEIGSTFKTTFAEGIPLGDLLQPERLRQLRRMSSGAKVMVCMD